MFCIDCTNSKFVPNPDGIVDLKCMRFKKNVLAYSRCLNTKRFEIETRARTIYNEHYQTKPLREIARMIGYGWTVSKLNYFIDSRFLPRARKQIRKRKEIKVYGKAE